MKFFIAHNFSQKLILFVLLSASLVTFAYILTCVLGGLMGQYIGRKRSMMLVAPISILAFLCQALAPGKEVLFFGRFLVGVGGGLVSGPCSVSCHNKH